MVGAGGTTTRRSMSARYHASTSDTTVLQSMPESNKKYTKKGPSAAAVGLSARSSKQQQQVSSSSKAVALRSSTPTSNGTNGNNNNESSKVDGSRSGRSWFQIWRVDLITIIIFTVLAIITRFYRIEQPDSVVFDELHFSKFCDRLLTGTWFFDIHPPLGKLILAYGSYIMGYRADPTFVIDRVGKPYPTHVKYYLMRYISAFFSVLTVPITYIIARLLNLSISASILSTSTVLLDFIGLIEGRLILMDSQLLFFCQLSLALALLLWRTVPGSQARVILLIATGVACGLALSIKHTALATPALIVLVSFLDIHFTNMPLSLMECGAAIVCGLGVYAGCFYVLFQAVHHTGERYDGFMPLHFRRTLIGSNEYDPSAVRAPFHQLFMYLNRRMITSNASVKRRHNWESKWYDWIINRRGILFYSFRQPRSPDSDSAERLKTQIYLIGNPVVVWLVLGVVVTLMVSLAIGVRYRRSLDRLLLKSSGRATATAARFHLGTAVFLICGWICNLVPYILVDRAAFLYHYLPGMFYGQLLCGLAVDGLPRRGRKTVVSIAVTLMAAAVVYWGPWIYGLPLTDAQHARRRWVSKWN